MIRFENLSKSFWVNGRCHLVLDNLNLELPKGRSIALLGRNGAGKSTLLQIIAGTMQPSSGRLVSQGRISWPVGFSGAFHLDLTGAQNVRFIARIYGVESDALIGFVEDFAELGPQFHLPLRSYSTGMRARLAFGASMGIGFETYLVDEITAVGDQQFRRKSRAVFATRMQDSSAILVSHDLPDLRSFCDAAMVLEAGRLTYFPDLDAGIAYHKELMD